MEPRWSFHHFREEIRVVALSVASRIERATAEEPHTAARLVRHVLEQSLRSDHERRALLVAMADVGAVDAGWWSLASLERRALDRITGKRDLIVVRERETPESCGSVHGPEHDTPQLAPPAPENSKLEQVRKESGL